MKTPSIVMTLLLVLMNGLIVAQTDALTILPNGNIGVGTTTPTQMLEVNGNIQGSSAFLGNANWGSDHASFNHKVFGNQQTHYALLHRNDGETFLNASLGKSIRFRINNVDKIIVHSNGNFGIGMTTPKIIVDVKENSIIGSSGQSVSQHDVSNRGTKVSFGHQGSEFVGMRTIISPGTNACGNSADIGFDTWECNTSTSREVMRINGTGNVGIGTKTPTQAKLVVSGNAKYKLGKFQWFAYYQKGTGVASGSDQIPYSIYATDRIAAQQFNAFSDARIKTIFGVSNAAKDLETLSKIKITNYRMIDTITKGNQIHKKVIAQQVKEVYPQAVTTDVIEVIPNIYELSTIKDGWIHTSTKDLVVGDNLKLIFSEEEVLVKVLEIKDDAIKVASDQEGSVFVYGKQVSDFHTVDYEAIAMLNVSATQALLKRTELLEKEKVTLSRKQKQLEDHLNTSVSRIEKLEILFNNLK